MVYYGVVAYYSKATDIRVYLFSVIITRRPECHSLLVTKKHTVRPNIRLIGASIIASRSTG